MDIKDYVIRWAQEVIDYCDPIAKRINKDFYCFQGAFPTKERVKLMVIGINPGGDGPYRAGRTPQSLAQDVNIYDVREGHQHPDNTNMVGKLSRAFTTPELQKALAESIPMNIYYFNTQNVAKLEASLSREIKSYCQNKTRELIGIIKPQRIIFLCSRNNELSALGVQQIKGIGSYMKTGVLDGVEVIIMPNPGYYRAYSYANGAEMATKLKAYLD